MTDHEIICEEVKRRLKEYCLTYKWLQRELTRREVKISTNEISDILTLHRLGTRAEGFASLMLQLLEGYELFYIQRQ